MLTWNANELERTLSERMEADIASCEIGGAVAVVSQHGETLCRVVRGSSNASLGTPLGYDALFRLASMCKPLTAAAVLLLMERGALALEDPVSRWLPAFRGSVVGRLDEHGRAVPAFTAQTPLTIHHLLTHTGGIISGPLGAAQMAGAPPEALAEPGALVDYLATCLLDFEPGTRWMYSGIGAFDILARVVEVISGQEFGAFLRRELFEPLEMPDTCFEPDPPRLGRLVAMHDCVEGRSVALPAVESVSLNLPNSLHSGSGTLVGSAEDYLHFAGMLANGGAFRGRQVLRAETAALAGTPRLQPGLPNLGAEINWGCGMMVRLRTVLPAGAFGWSGAYGTHFWADPANRLAAVYMRNSAQANGAGAATAFRFEADVMACARGG